MAVGIKSRTTEGVAAGAIELGTVILWDGTDNPATAAATLVRGVAFQSFETDDKTSVMEYNQDTEGKAGVAIAVGDVLAAMSDGSGRLVPASLYATTTVYPVGIALSATTAADETVQFMTIAPFPLILI